MKKKTVKKAPKAKKKSNAPKKKTRIEKLEAVVSDLNIRLYTLEAIVNNLSPTVDFSGTAGNSTATPYVTTAFPVYFDYAGALIAAKKQ